jgi:hypothetical protein
MHASQNTASASGETKAPIYTKDELDGKIKRLKKEITELNTLWSNTRKLLDTIYVLLCKKMGINANSVQKINELIYEFRDAIYDVIDELVVSELELDTDIEKYEKQYNVAFSYDTERLLGVVMLKEDDTTRPVVVWTDYKSIGYWRGVELSNT